MVVERRKKKWDKRPPAVSVVAWAIVILFAIRLVQFIQPLLDNGVFKNGISGPLIAGMEPTPLGDAVFTSAFYLVLSLSGIVVLIAFLRLHRWSWVVLMAWTGISLLITLINYFYSQPNYLVMASNVIIAVALNQEDVQRIFKIRTDDGEPIKQPVR